MTRGLREDQIERIIKTSLDKNPDLKYYIDDEYVLELIDLLIEGVSKAIEENNQKLISDLLRS